MTGTSCHMRHNNANMFDIRPVPSSRKVIKIGDRCRLRVKYIGSMDVVFHGYMDKKTTLLTGCCYVTGLGSDLYSLHTFQRTNLIISDASGAQIIGNDKAFPFNSIASYLRANHFPAKTVGAKWKAMYAYGILRQLRHPVPPPPTGSHIIHVLLVFRVPRIRLFLRMMHCMPV